jgi:hypothetical protein
MVPSNDHDNGRAHVRTNGTTMTQTHTQQAVPEDIDLGHLSPRSKERDSSARKGCPELESDARGLVPLREVVDRMVHQAFADLQNLTEM